MDTFGYNMDISKKQIKIKENQQRPFLGESYRFLITLF